MRPHREGAPQAALPGILSPLAPPTAPVPAATAITPTVAPTVTPAAVTGPRGMIRIGYADAAKLAMVRAAIVDRGADRVVLFTPPRFDPGWTAEDLGVPVQRVSWADAIMYRVYYPLLRELNDRSLIVVNEFLRSQNRHELTYNCLRHYTNLTPHTLVFQRFPLIDTFADFGVLYDLVTRSRWKRVPVADLPLAEADIAVADTTPEALAPFLPTLTRVDVPTTPDLRARYAREKAALIEGIGGRDPAIIPRTLLLTAGKAKLDAPAVVAGAPLVGRNNRFKLPTLATFDAVSRAAGKGSESTPDAPAEPTAECSGTTGDRTVFELCHDFIDLADFLTVTGQTRVPCLVTDLKVDGWYFDRFTAWAGRIRDACAVLRAG